MTIRPGDVTTRRAAVIGWPVGHSLSPVIHRLWLKRYGLDGDYEAIAASPENFKARLETLRKKGYAGVNVTLPHKGRAFALAHSHDEVSEATRACNTLLFGKNGEVKGMNTDAYGFAEGLTAQTPHWREVVRGRPAVIIGAGGAARAICYALAEAGCAEARVVNRSLERARELAAYWQKVAGGEKTRGKTHYLDVTPLPWPSLGQALSAAALVVNASPQGMKGFPALHVPLRKDVLFSDAVICDIVYVPVRTSLLQEAERLGLAVADGLGMLTHQARPGFAAWFGVVPDAEGVSAARRKLEDILKARCS